MIKNLISKLPSTTINVGGKPYLTRYYLFFKDRNWGNIYIHHFHSSDQGDELHSHPWKWAFSFIVSGGYNEEYRTADGRVVSRFKRSIDSIPDMIVQGIFVTLKQATNFITSRDFHRVDLLDEERGTWTLFIAGPRVKSWGFWNRHTNEFRDWRTNPEAIP